MRGKIYIMTLILLTFITTVSMTYLHPDKDNILPNEVVRLVEGFANESRGNDTSNVNHIIEEDILNKFANFYAAKDISELEIYEKEELRYILETMGIYNIDKLKILLGNSPIKEEEVYNLLSENLFDKDIMKINEILK